MVLSGEQQAQERAVVGVAIEVVSQEWGLTVHDIRYPEEQRPPPGRPVDAIVETRDGTTIVVEHTVHLSFEGQIQDGVRLQNQLLPLVRRLSNKLPGPGHYQLGVGIGAIDGEPRLDEESIGRWIVKTAPTLGIGKTYSGPKHFAVVLPPETPIPLSLYRFQGPPDDGSLDLSRFIDASHLDLLRRERARTALQKKLPKLAEHRPPDGRSVLVLENPDIQLVNAGNTADALKGAAEDEPALPMPDVILLVHFIGPSWWVDWLKDGDDWYPQLERNKVARNPRPS